MALGIQDLESGAGRSGFPLACSGLQTPDPAHTKSTTCVCQIVDTRLLNLSTRSQTLDPGVQGLGARHGGLE